jgi:hypothetical protein
MQKICAQYYKRHIVHISVIPTQRFRSYPPSVFTDTWLSLQIYYFFLKLSPLLWKAIHNKGESMRKRQKK